MKGLMLDPLIASLAGAVLSIDRTAAFQTMVSRPIVAAPVVGFLLGNAMAGLVVGAALELLLIGDPPVGAHLPVHETSLAAAVTALTIPLAGTSGGGGPLGGIAGAIAAFPVVLAAVLPLGWVYVKADEITRRLNSRFFSRASEALDEGGPAVVIRENLKGAGVFFASTFVALLITVVPMSMAEYFIIRALPEDKLHLLYPAFAGCAVIGIAAALNVLHNRRSLAVFISTAALGAVLLALTA